MPQHTYFYSVLRNIWLSPVHVASILASNWFGLTCMKI